MNKINLNLTIDISDKSQKEAMEKIFSIISERSLASTTQQVVGSNQQQRRNVPPGVNTQELKKKHMEEIENCLRQLKGNGAFVYTDLFKNKSKYGLSLQTSGAIYKAVKNLVEAKKAIVLKMNNPSSNNTNTLQDYVRLL